MKPVPKYGAAKLAEGDDYLEFVRACLNPHGITFWPNNEPLFQLRGESQQGLEVKLDRRCLETQRLSIEVAEKSDPALSYWTPSGILKQDNSWAYIQGNYELIFVFSKAWLLRYYKSFHPEIHEALGTIRKFYLPLHIARIACVLAVDGNGKRVE